MSYAKEDLDTIRNKVDMLTYLENRGISFRNSGASWVGLCPVHSERSPSFHVRPAMQTFRCYGCGISGDIFTLVQEIEQLSFPGAVQLLAEEAGIALKMDEDPKFKHRQRLSTINRLAAEWYRHHYGKIPMDHPAKHNLEERNLLEFSISDESVGFAPNGGLLPILRQKGFTEKELLESGIVIEGKDESKTIRERFRNRLIWTIYDIQGRPIGFSARRIFDNDTGAKYLNSPQTELYNKSKALLGLSSARRAISQQQEVYVVEGQTDVMALRASGKENTVAYCGTAFVTMLICYYIYLN
jgi:DNA primase